MNDFVKMFEDMVAQSQKMAQQFAPSAEMFDPANLDKLMPGMSKQFLDSMFGDAINKGGLDAKTRFLVVIGALTAQGGLQESQIKLAVRSAQAAGATQREVLEVIFQMAMIGGLPATTAAMTAAQDVFASDDTDGESEA